MYRNCKFSKCCCCNNDNSDKEDVLEDICDNVMPITEYQYDECACGFDEEESLFPTNPMFGESYVPIQRMNKTFTPEIGLRMGTIFPELVSPYMPCQSMDRIEYLRRSNQIKEGCNNV